MGTIVIRLHHHILPRQSVSQSAGGGGVTARRHTEDTYPHIRIDTVMCHLKLQLNFKFNTAVLC